MIRYYMYGKYLQDTTFSILKGNLINLIHRMGCTEYTKQDEKYILKKDIYMPFLTIDNIWCDMLDGI